MRLIPMLLAMAACLLFALPAAAGDGCGCDSGGCDQACCGNDGGDCCGGTDCCGLCGCKAPCNAYCVVECGTETVTRPCFKVECEPFCLPMPRCCGGLREILCPRRDCCDTTCGCCADGSDGCGSTCCCHEVPVEKMPKCGKVRVKKRLLRAECEIQVPSYKCVVKYCCPTCRQDPGCCVDPGCCEPASGGVQEEPQLAAPAPEAQAYNLAPLPPE